MLKQRIITALVLLPLMLGMLFFANPIIWTLFTGIISLLALWEYGRLCHLNKNQHILYLSVTLLFGFCLYYFHLTNKLIYLYFVVPIFWLIIVPCWLKNKWKIHPNLFSMAVGWLLILPFWLALIGFKPDSTSAETLTAKVMLGIPLLFLMSMVWIADISAYFIGRAIGKHKLAPVISPNKSWEGAIGAVLCVSVYTTACIFFVLDNNKSPVVYILGIGGSIILTSISILGDLLESWLKRAAGVKDSSALLPGHGGVLDRVDSLIAVLGFCYTVMILLFNGEVFIK